jgi:hypothetical protein
MGSGTIGRSTDEMFDEILEQLDYTIEVLDVFHDLTGKKERLPTEQKPLSSPQSKNKVLFDTKISTLTLGKKECLIPDESLEHYVCKLVFKNRKIGAKETDVLDAAGFGQNSIRPVYDAHLRVNTKAKEHLGIEKLLVYKAAKIRLNKVNQ